MKTLQQQRKPNFSNEKIDATTSKIQATIIPMAEITAELHATKPQPLSEAKLHIELTEGIIRPAVQEGINVVRKELQVAAEVLNTKELLQTLEKRIEQNNTNIAHKKNKIVELSQGQPMRVYKKKKRSLIRINWIEVVFYLIAGIDGVFSYNNFRVAGFSRETSAVMAAFVFGAILISRILFVPWVQNAGGKKIKMHRGTTAIALIAIFFYFISLYRTEGVSHISLDPAGTNTPPTTASVWPQFIISYTLFLMVFFLHLVQWRSDFQKQKQSGEFEKQDMIAVLTEKIEELNTQNTDAKELMNERKIQLRYLLDYYHKQIKTLEQIGEAAIARYKKVYAGYVQNIPPFFLTEHKITYDTELKFYSPEN